jgi:hypothetical protein
MKNSLSDFLERTNLLLLGGAAKVAKAGPFQLCF